MFFKRGWGRSSEIGGGVSNVWRPISIVTCVLVETTHVNIGHAQTEVTHPRQVGHHFQVAIHFGVEIFTITYKKRKVK